MKKIIKFIMIFSISIILVLSFSSITGFAASADNSFTGYYVQNVNEKWKIILMIIMIRREL